MNEAPAVGAVLHILLKLDDVALPEAGDPGTGERSANYERRASSSMPSAWSLRYKVVRPMPSRLAAFDRLPSLCRSAARISVRSADSIRVSGRRFAASHMRSGRW